MVWPDNCSIPGVTGPLALSSSVINLADPAAFPGPATPDASAGFNAMPFLSVLDVLLGPGVPDASAPPTEPPKADPTVGVQSASQLPAPAEINAGVPAGKALEKLSTQAILNFSLPPLPTPESAQPQVAPVPKEIGPIPKVPVAKDPVRGAEFTAQQVLVPVTHNKPQEQPALEDVESEAELDPVELDPGEEEQPVEVPPSPAFLSIPLPTPVPVPLPPVVEKPLTKASESVFKPTANAEAPAEVDGLAEVDGPAEVDRQEVTGPAPRRKPRPEGHSEEKSNSDPGVGLQVTTLATMVQKDLPAQTTVQVQSKRGERRSGASVEAFTLSLDRVESPTQGVPDPMPAVSRPQQTADFSQKQQASAKDLFDAPMPVAEPDSRPQTVKGAADKAESDLSKGASTLEDAALKPVERPQVVVKHSEVVLDHPEPAGPDMRSSTPAEKAPTSSPSSSTAAQVDRVERLRSQPKPTTPLTEVVLQVAKGDEIVDIQVRGVRGKVDVAVTTNQELLASTLRHELPQLVDGLQQQGYRADVRGIPAAESASGSQEERLPSAATQAYQQAQDGASQESHERSRRHGRQPQWPDEEE